ncbi:MAG: hypothetical protein JSV79_11765 [Armatimonadota bacterium]|nr:MAG: hypothetical protein JSV79_11765 [Armatimonadota bacterium]
MSVTMRIIQRFDPRHEREFMALEREFAKLEAERPDYPKGRRRQPISGREPCNTLIWEGEFPDVEAARKALDFFDGDPAHEALFAKQLPYFKDVRVEFYANLDM